MAGHRGLPGHDLGDVQSGQGKLRAGAFKREMGGVVRANEEVRTRASEPLDAVGEDGADGVKVACFRRNSALENTRTARDGTSIRILSGLDLASVPVAGDSGR